MEKHIKLIILPVILSFAAQNTIATDTKILESAVNTKLQAQKDILQSQENVDQRVTQTRELAREYRAIIRKTDSLETYNTQLSKLIAQQKISLVAIKRQLDNAEETQRSIVPLMIKMIETLEKFVQLDLPFLLQERQQRVASLKDIMDRPDVALPEKYRRIMEAYQIEMEYGRTIATYTDTISMEGQTYTVNMLRIGRLLVSFQTLDGKLSGHWHREHKIWEVLPSAYNRSIAQGIKIAKKQTPPELIKLPVNIAGK